MVSILTAYHDGEWKRERFQSIGEARRVAYLGEQRGVIHPVRIEVEKYRKGHSEKRVNWKRADDGPFTEWMDENFADVPNPPEYLEIAE